MDATSSERQRLASLPRNLVALAFTLFLTGLAVVVAPATPTGGAAQSPRLSAAIAPGSRGTLATLEGTGFPAGAAGTLSWDARPTEPSTGAGAPPSREVFRGAVRSSDDGRVTAAIRLPRVRPDGLRLTVSIRGVVASADLRVAAARRAAGSPADDALLILSPSAGGPGDTFALTGGRFPRDKAGRLTWGSSPEVMRSFRSSQQGSFRLTGRVPEGAAGRKLVTASVGTALVAAPYAQRAPRPVNPGNRPRVVAYFPIWNPPGYTADDVDFSIVTDVAHFSVSPRPDGSIDIPDWGPFPDPDLVKGVHAAGARIVLVVGGDHQEATAAFSAMAADATARRRFVANLVALVDEQGYDGVDLDWEFPHGDADRANLTKLVREVRAGLGSTLTLSIAGPGSDWNGQWYDIPALAPHLDWFGSMTYTFASASWSEQAGHNSALYGPSSVDSARAYFVSRGLPKEKFLAGIPFFAERFDGADQLGQKLRSDAGGALEYQELADLLDQDWVRSRDTLAGDMPYLTRTNGPGVIVYDDPISVAAKCAYVTREKLGGVILWRLGQDGQGADQPLLRAVRGCRNS